MCVCGKRKSQGSVGAQSGGVRRLGQLTGYKWTMGAIEAAERNGLLRCSDPQSSVIMRRSAKEH